MWPEPYHSHLAPPTRFADYEIGQEHHESRKHPLDISVRALEPRVAPETYVS